MRDKIIVALIMIVIIAIPAIALAIGSHAKENEEGDQTEDKE